MKKAFTIAELLITLSTIGVLAALVMPTLYRNINDSVSRHTKMVQRRKISQGITMLSIRSTRIAYATTEAFVKDLQKYMQISKYCTEDKILDCWPTSTITINNGVSDEEFSMASAKGKALFLMDDIDPEGNEASYAVDNVAFVTNNGVSVLINYNTKCNPNTNNWNRTCYVALVDSNGAKGPNKMGKDLFLLNANGFKYAVSDGTETAGSSGANKRNTFNDNGLW